ncbi:MAG: hypothetical protein JXA22_06850 [Candidatus Thermoplasmatota archaeon]|nr:hypothetical protein [Candidatus Thermoplasmatota archaeon]
MENGKWIPARAAFLTSMLLITVISMVSFIDEATEDADAVLPISAQFYFDSEQDFRTGNLIEIGTGPEETGQVTVDGTLEFYRSAKFLRTRIMIDLKFSSDNPEVTGTVFPSMIDIQPQAKLNHYPIKVNIQIAPMTKYSTGVNPLVNVTVFGTWQANYQFNEMAPFASGDISPYPLYVNVKPYHYLYMTFDPVMLDLSPGSSGWVRCIVKNSGNGFERVELSMPGATAYAKAGWVFEFESTVLDIGPDAEGWTRIKITSPRKLEPKYHMEMHDFSVLAVSHYSSYQVKDGNLEAPIEYESGVFVQINGFDFLYVPWTWTVLFYVVIWIVLFNFGIDPFTMRRRRTRDPGFKALYRRISDPKRRARARTRREERRKLRRELRESKKQKAQLEKGQDVPKALPGTKESSQATTSRKDHILDLKRSDDGLDLDLSEPENTGKLAPGKARAPLLGGGKVKREKVEKEMIDVLSSLDD